MATAYGVTAQGFVAKSLATIKAEITAALLEIIGASAGTEPDGSIPDGSMAGQLVALMVDRETAHWDLMQAVYAACDRAQAMGASLDVVGALIGALRQLRQFSTATVTCVGVPGTQLLAGRAVKVTGTGSRFDGAAATIAAANAWAGTTNYSLGDRVTNAGNVYRCTTAGQSASSGGPTTQGSGIVDGGAQWLFLGAGTGFVDVLFTAEVAGPVGALAGTLVNIDTPVSGWNAAYNALDAAVGRNQESDAVFRPRQDAVVAGAGTSPKDAIRAKVIKVNQGSTDPNHQPPTSCTVYANPTDYTDANGLSPHSVECLVVGGTDADIALAIWQAVAAGTATVGTTQVTVADSQGNPQVVSFTRPQPVLIYITTTAKYDASVWSGSNPGASVAQAVLSALLTYGLTYVPGADLRAGALQAAALRGPSQVDANGNAVVPAISTSAPVPGLWQLDPLYIGTAPNPSSNAQITIGTRQFAQFDSSRCTITAAAESP